MESLASPRFEVEFEAAPGFVRRATRASYAVLARRLFLDRKLLWCLASAVLFAWAWVRGGSSVWLWVFGAGPAMMLAVVLGFAALAAVGLRQARREDESLEPRVRVAFDDEVLHVENGDESASIRWERLKDVGIHRDFWLLGFGRDSRFAIPSEHLAPEAREVVLELASRHGARVLGRAPSA